MQKISQNSKILKNDGHFWNPHPQISLKQFSNIWEHVVYFFLLCRGVQKWLRIFAKQILKKKMVSFFYILQLPHNVISNSEKLTHPTVQYMRVGWFLKSQNGHSSCCAKLLDHEHHGTNLPSPWGQGKGMA